MTNTYMMRHVTSALARQYRNEIERAIANVKRSELDKRFRREWYKAVAKRRWDERRRMGYRAGVMSAWRSESKEEWQRNRGSIEGDKEV